MASTKTTAQVARKLTEHSTKIHQQRLIADELGENLGALIETCKRAVQSSTIPYNEIQKTISLRQAAQKKYDAAVKKLNEMIAQRDSLLQEQLQLKLAACLDVIGENFTSPEEFIRFYERARKADEEKVTMAA